jgi:hypothetical protein
LGPASGLPSSADANVPPRVITPATAAAVKIRLDNRMIQAPWCCVAIACWLNGAARELLRQIRMTKLEIRIKSE